VNTLNAGTQHEIALTEYFEAPRLRVFANWTQSRLVRGWFAPDGFTVTDCVFDARPGAPWRVTFESATGERHTESGVFQEVVEPEKLVFTLTQQDGRGRSGEPTLVTVRFDDLGGRTRMEFRQSGYRSASTRDGNQQGWGECFRKLAAQLAK
jgi:uncharacterized protein YndB with AHSA1/START domain